MIKTSAAMLEETDFDQDLRTAIELSDGVVCFYCDDDIVYRTLEDDPATMLLNDDELLSFSLSRGVENRGMALPEGFPRWRWQDLPPHDFGYPCGVDAHYYRSADINRMLQEHVANPNLLETILHLAAERLAAQRPYFACFERQHVVGVPVNRVSRISTIPVGQKHAQPTEQINRMWLAGNRIRLDMLNTRGVRGVHHEMLFRWEKRQ
jgi:hypothetical protein